MGLFVYNCPSERMKVKQLERDNCVGKLLKEVKNLKDELKAKKRSIRECRNKELVEREALIELERLKLDEDKRMVKVIIAFVFKSKF